MTWRTLLARLPLPTLALAAAYGVWSFQALFVPWWVALISAASFELVYMGLAVAHLDTADRRRATLISIGAVVVSVLYNSLSALFAIRPALLIGRPLWADVCLAVAHGLPLAVVAYLVADLLLHASHQIAQSAHTPISTPEPSAHQCAQCGASVASQQAAAASMRWGCAACKAAKAHTNGRAKEAIQ